MQSTKRAQAVWKGMDTKLEQHVTPKTGMPQPCAQNEPAIGWRWIQMAAPWVLTLPVSSSPACVKCDAGIHCYQRTGKMLYLCSGQLAAFKWFWFWGRLYVELMLFEPWPSAVSPLLRLPAFCWRLCSSPQRVPVHEAFPHVFIRSCFLRKFSSAGALNLLLMDPGLKAQCAVSGHCAKIFSGKKTFCWMYRRRLTLPKPPSGIGCREQVCPVLHTLQM